jgi:hypothetical protein
MDCVGLDSLLTEPENYFVENIPKHLQFNRKDQNSGDDLLGVK